MHQELLTLARNNIRTFLETGRDLTFVPPADSPLHEKRGVFVTLTEHDELRGCIGSLIARDPLYKAVQEMSHAAAFEDPRFRPLRVEELDRIRIEISILSPLQLIEDWTDIRLGVDGVVVRQGFRSGVFLPQVATETGWDLPTFLSQLCRGKAGLPGDAYKNPKTEMFVFQVEKFAENE
jgi:AmmeMemoRadiSam system protein A